MTAPRRRPAPQGFTLIEAMISLFVMVLLMVAILGLFDFTTRLSRVQLQLSDMQQEQRIGHFELAKFIRMAGRGGLPVEIAPITGATPVVGKTLPDGAAVALRVNNAGASVRIGDATSPLIYPGTDVLTVRGAFTNPVYQINYAATTSVRMLDAGGAVTSNPALTRRVVVQVCARTSAGVDQDLSGLTSAITNNSQDAILIVSPLQDSIFGMVALDPTNSLTTATNCPTTGVTLSLTVGSKTAGGTRADAYADLSPAPRLGRLMPGLTSVGFLALVEEYRFYVRREYVVPSDTTSTPAPRLSRAQFYPNTDVTYGGNAQNLSVDVAENIVDLQIALGIDEDQDDVVIDDPVSECGNEWMGDGVGTESSNPLNARVVGVCKWDGRPLYYVRVSTVARTDRSDPSYSASYLGQVENHVYPTTATGENSDENRMRRRRLLQTIVKVRNL